MCYGRTTPVIDLVVLSARERGEWRVGEGAELVQDLSSHRVLRDLGGKAGETGVSAGFADAGAERRWGEPERRHLGTDPGLPGVRPRRLLFRGTAPKSRARAPGHRCL